MSAGPQAQASEPTVWVMEKNKKYVCNEGWAYKRLLEAKQASSQITL